MNPRSWWLLSLLCCLVLFTTGCSLTRSGKAQKDGIMSGEMAGAITQNPIGIGACVVESAVKALKGEKLPKTVDTGFYYYDKTNVDDPKVAAVLYK